MPRNICVDASSGTSPPAPPSVPRFKQRYSSWMALALRKVLIAGVLFGLLICGCSACGSTHQGSVKDDPPPVQSPSTHPISKAKKTPTPLPTPCSTQTSPPTPASPSTLYVKEWLARYLNAILDGKENALLRDKLFHQAYNLLSPDICAKLSFEAFKTSQEYMLPNHGCWSPWTSHVSHPDAQTWEVGVELLNVQCDNYGHINYYALWHFRIQRWQGQLWIVAVGFYPTAAAP